MKKEAWMHWTLLGEYGCHPIAHISLTHALCVNDRMKQNKACFFWLREFGNHMTSPMFMQNIIHHPLWDEWVRMISKGLHDHLQIYDMGQK